MGNLSQIVLDDETLEVEDTKARTDIGELSSLQTTTKDSLVKAVNECFQFASDGKALIASAITGKGIATNADATFTEMAEKIAAIETGIKTSDATATAAQILSGATAYGANGKITGSMKNLTTMSGIEFAPGNSTKVIETDAVFHQTNTDNVDRVLLRYAGENGYVQSNTLFGISASNLASTLGITADKIVVGHTILGITGTGYGTWS